MMLFILCCYIYNFLFSASIPANVEYDISGKELHDHFSRTNGCHFTFLDEEGWIETNYKMKVQLRLIIDTFLEFYMYRKMLVLIEIVYSQHLLIH